MEERLPVSTPKTQSEPTDQRQETSRIVIRTLRTEHGLEYAFEVHGLCRCQNWGGAHPTQEEAWTEALRIQKEIEGLHASHCKEGEAI